jgi:hypothetical protein
MLHLWTINDVTHAVRSCNTCGALASLSGPVRAFVLRELQLAPIPNGHLQRDAPQGWLARELNRWDQPAEVVGAMLRYAAGIDLAARLDPETPVDATFWHMVGTSMIERRP